MKALAISWIFGSSSLILLLLLSSTEILLFIDSKHPRFFLISSHELHATIIPSGYSECLHSTTTRYTLSHSLILRSFFYFKETNSTKMLRSLMVRRKTKNKRVPKWVGQRFQCPCRLCRTFRLNRLRKGEQIVAS